MPLINTHEVVDRNNRPAVQSRVMLRTFFINQGEYQDPLYVSSVHIFARSQNLTPASVLDDEGLVASSMTFKAEMVFGPSGNAKVNGADSQQFAPSGYSQRLNNAPLVFDNAGADGVVGTEDDVYVESDTNGIRCENVSGIYRLGRGEYACVLDGVLGTALSGIDGNGNSITNTADMATRYIDVWTVQIGEASKFKTFINEFELYDDTAITLTEPALLRTKNTLFNRRVSLGSITDLKIGTEITVENKNIDMSVKNIFKESAITGATVEIQKINEDPNLPGRFTVVDSSSVNITSDNTIVYTFNTSGVFANGDINGEAPVDPAVIAKFKDNIGNRRGTYALRVSYQLLHEKIVSEFMYFIVQ